METKNSIVPWNEFLDTLEKQQPGQLQFWLHRWQFSDGGALPADDRGAAMHFAMLRWLPVRARQSLMINSPANADAAGTSE